MKGWTRWWQARSSRERWLAIGVAVLAAAAAVDALLLAPLRAEVARLARAGEAAQANLTRLRDAAERQASEGEETLRARRAALEARRARAAQAIANAQVDLIAPQDMSRQLQAILAQHARLRVVGMQSIAAKPLAEAADGGAAAAGLYQHGLEVSIEGPYLDLLAYLRALERAPHRLYWRELDLRVGANGVPTTKLVFFTLSKEPTWLRL
jgi:MSHA biogenesis protein MshJ